MSLARYGVITVVVILTLSGCDEQRDIASVWKTGAARVDGKGNEWSDVALNYFEEGEVSWGIMNDSERIYLIVVSSNEESIRRLRQSGITLWFSSTGEKKKRDFGVRLRGGMTAWTPPRDFDQTEGKSAATAPQKSHDGYVTVLDITAFDNQGHEAPISKSGEDGPIVASGCEEAVCSYEMSVPINKSDAAVAYAMQSAPGKKIGIYVELSVPKRAHRLTADNESPGMGGHGEGRPPTGMGSRGMGRGDRSGHENSKQLELEKKEIWLSVTLATKPATQGQITKLCQVPVSDPIYPSTIDFSGCHHYSIGVSIRQIGSEEPS
jgi:hypothetical protein